MTCAHVNCLYWPKIICSVGQGPNFHRGGTFSQRGGSVCRVPEPRTRGRGLPVTAAPGRWGLRLKCMWWHVMQAAILSGNKNNCFVQIDRIAKATEVWSLSRDLLRNQPELTRYANYITWTSVVIRRQLCISLRFCNHNKTCHRFPLGQQKKWCDIDRLHLTSQVIKQPQYILHYILFYS